MLKNLHNWWYAAVAVLILTVHLFTSVSAQPRWQYQCYGTVDNMVQGLNGKRDFHILAVPSSRNMLGFAGSPYCVVYR